jgi:hypothetical protein
MTLPTGAETAREPMTGGSVSGERESLARRPLRNDVMTPVGYNPVAHLLLS